MRYRLLLWILFSLLILSFPSYLVYSEENFSFRIEPIFPASQIGNKGYYHLKGTPNDRVTLQARVINESTQELHVIIRGLNAYSGSQGIIYQEEPILEGTSIAKESYQFKDTVTTPSEITVPPLESEIVEFTVSIPSITGTLLGSMEFRVFQGTEQLTEKDENAQLLIDQYKAINLGVQVDVSAYDEAQALVLESPRYSAEQVAIMIPMVNQQPIIVPNISGTYKVTKDEDEAFSLSGDIPSFKMAPMTTFHYPLRWSSGTLEPGTYHVAIALDVNGNTQNYEQTLSINNKEVQETQDKMEQRGELEIAPKAFPWTTLIIIILLIVVVILLIMMRKSKPRRKDRKYPGQDSNET